MNDWLRKEPAEEFAGFILCQTSRFLCRFSRRRLLCCVQEPALTQTSGVMLRSNISNNASVLDANSKSATGIRLTRCIPSKEPTDKSAGSRMQISFGARE